MRDGTKAFEQAYRDRHFKDYCYIPVNYVYHESVIHPYMSRAQIFNIKFYLIEHMFSDHYDVYSSLVPECFEDFILNLYDQIDNNTGVDLYDPSTEKIMRKAELDPDFWTTAKC